MKNVFKTDNVLIFLFPNVIFKILKQGKIRKSSNTHAAMLTWKGVKEN